MVVGIITDEHVSPISIARLWKAGVRDMHLLVPKLMPEVIASIEILEGDGGVGCIKQFNFTGAMKEFQYTKDRVDIMDEEKHLFKSTIIEGGILSSKVKSYSFELSYEPTSDGGCLVKMKMEYDSIEDGFPTEAHVAMVCGGIMGMVKAVEGYLLANPDACA